MEVGCRHQSHWSISLHARGHQADEEPVATRRSDY
jgi:hypothetical protein